MKKNTTLGLIEFIVQEQENIVQVPDILSDVLQNPVGTSYEEVYTYDISGYATLEDVHPDGKCGSTEQFGTNYSVSVSFKNKQSKPKIQKFIYSEMSKFSSNPKGMIWKASCEEIANTIVRSLAKFSPVEVIASVSPNEKTTVTTHWQDHLQLPNINECANDSYAKSLPKAKPIYAGCG